MSDPDGSSIKRILRCATGLPESYPQQMDFYSSLKGISNMDSFSVFDIIGPRMTGPSRAPLRPVSMLFFFLRLCRISLI